jgi:hypothetical protein
LAHDNDVSKIANKLAAKKMKNLAKAGSLVDASATEQGPPPQF